MNDETLLEELKNYEDKWVALLEPEKNVVGSGNDASEAKQDAERKGYHNFILLKVLPFRMGYIPVV
ncbi:MAG: DUF5678 domain-containing protein [Ignavibacteriales bacterium]